MAAPASRITIGTPTEVAGIVPYILGFHPSDSLVFVAMTGKRVLFGLRTELQTNPGDGDAYRRHMDDVAARFVGHHATGAVLIGYGAAPPIALSITAARLALTAAGVPVHGAHRVADGRVWDLTCTDPRCCPSEGVRFDPRASVPAAEATLAGLVALPDRDAVARQLAPTTGTARAAFATATHAAVDRLLAQVERLPAHVDIDDDAVLQTTSMGRSLLREGRQLLTIAADSYRHGRPLDDRRAALLTVLMQLSGVRDVAVSRCTSDDWQLGMWIDLVRRAELEYVSGPAVLLAVNALLAGNGVLADCAVRRALDADPGYVLAQLLADVLRVGVSPAALAALLAH
jgi:hypothetical protein